MNAKKDAMYQRIEKHGANLNAIFNTKFDNVILCKKLRQLELKAERLAIHYCNGTGGVTTENWFELCLPILSKVNTILNNGKGEVDIFINGDARGYALQINDAYVREHKLQIHTDLGGYGIIAPDLTEG